MKLLLGGGWWTLWYALMYLCAYPILGMGRYFKTFQPGKGPQGGEVVMMGGCMLYMVMLGIAIVNAVIWSRSKGDFLGPGVALGGTVVSLVLLTLAYSRLGETKTEFWIGTTLLWIGLAIFLASNLYVLAQARNLVR